MNTLDILKSAREKIAAGYVTRIRSASGPGGRMYYCALGAIDAALGNTHNYSQWCTHDTEAVQLLAAEIPAGEVQWYFSPDYACRVADYNNNTTQARTVALFDRAIAKLEAAQFISGVKAAMAEPLVEVEEAVLA